MHSSDMNHFLGFLKSDIGLFIFKIVHLIKKEFKITVFNSY